MIQKVKDRLTAAMKARSPEKDILRVYLGALQKIEADEGAAKLTDERCEAVAKSIIKGNNEAIEAVIAEQREPPADWKAKLEAENAVMQTFLPQYLNASQVRTALAADPATLEKLQKSANDGAATGVAMKYLKSKDLKVDGNVVKEVAKIIWTEARQ